MWYFSYDHLAGWREMMRFYKRVPTSVPLPQHRQAATVRNSRLCFPVFSEQWHGGVASIEASPGKTVSGALFDLPRRAVESLDEYYGREIGWTGNETGAARRIIVQVWPYGRREPVRAVAHQAIASGTEFFPPGEAYLSLLVGAASEIGLSSLWVQHLMSFDRGGLCPVAA